MIYVIPAWYNKNQWVENEHKWYLPRTHTEMDDTVKQIQLFHRRSLADLKILSLGFAPNFRHFLHRQSMFHAPYWSCFDAMQCVETMQQHLISFHDMDWPEDAEFVYSLFTVIVMRQGKQYALIDFGDDGNMIQIDLYDHDRVSTRLRFDDRGFIGSRTHFDDDGSYREYYLDEQGDWKLCVFSDGHVRINPQSAYYLLDVNGKKYPTEYSKREYASIDLVIGEVLERHLRGTEAEDLYCVAMHPLHSSVLRRALDGRRTILSFWENRGLPPVDDDNLALVKGARCIIAGTEETLASVSSAYGTFSAKMVEISPYDVRVDLGTSRQISEQRILLPTDAISDEVLSRAIVICAHYLRQNPHARVHLFTRTPGYEVKDRVLSKVRQALRGIGFDPRAATDSDMEGSRQTDMDKIAQAGELAAADESPETEESDEELIKSLFVLEQCVDEMSINHCLRSVSLYVDLADTPDLFLQIECVSMCIPQVVMADTRYVEDGGNATIISEIDDLDRCLHYYFDNLGNWNAAMVCSYEIGQRFTTDRLVARWKEVLEESGRD